MVRLIPWLKTFALYQEPNMLTVLIVFIINNVSVSR